MAGWVMTAHPALGEGEGMEAESAPRTRYEIVVRGRLSARYGSAFEGLELKPRPGSTALRGEFADQAALHGVLDRLQDFGIELVSVNAID
jgi:hypothetical protein